MFVRIALLLVVSVLSTNTFAGETEELCAAGGYYSGAQDRFMSGLAMHILQKRGKLGSKMCNSLWQKAFVVGERFSKIGKMQSTDTAIINDVLAFSTRVYTSVAKGAGY